MAAAAPIKGEPVSADEVSVLEKLRGAFDPDESQKALDAFAVWLFASSGTLGALATAGKVVGIGELSDAGKTKFGYAALLFGIALGLAALAKAPQPARFNPHSIVSMRSQLSRIILTRAALLIAAAALFAVALGLAAFAPLSTTRAQRGHAPSLTYGLAETGRVTATFDVVDAKPFSIAKLTTAARPVKKKRVAPRATALTDANGRARLTLAVARRGARVIILRGNWFVRGGGKKQVRVTVPLAQP